MNLARSTLVAILLAAMAANETLAQTANTQPAATQPGTARLVNGSATHAASGATGGLPTALSPDWDGPSIMWFAIVVILVLVLRVRPVLSLQNLDGLMLALTCLALGMRDVLSASQDGRTWQWWGYLALAVLAGYWLIRGVMLVAMRNSPRPVFGLPGGAMLVLALAAMAINIHRLSTASLTEGSVDGMVGGVYMADTGKLPYGNTPADDARSPLLYVLHAGAAKASAPSLTMDGGASGVKMTWENREQWRDTAWWVKDGPLASRLINALLFLLIFLGTYLIGSRLHTQVAGITLAVIFAVFPGVTETVARPEILLPAALLVWSLAFALMPRVGGFLSLLTLVFAGLAWPWAWLAIPPAWMFFLRRGWHAFGSTLGLLLGVGACAAGLIYLVEPTLPRSDGIKSAAGQGATYEVIAPAPGRLSVVRVETPSGTEASSVFAPVWRFLLDRDDTLLTPGVGGDPIEVAPGIPAGELYYRNLVVRDEAAQATQARYRARVLAGTEATRFWAGLRTVIEATAMPRVEPPAPRLSAWRLWRGNDSAAIGQWQNIRRGAMAGAALLSLVLAGLMLFGRRGQPFHLVGAFAAVSAAALIASATGPVANWVWLLPVGLAAMAAHGATAPVRPVVATRTHSPFPPAPRTLGPAPRVTIE